MALWRAKDKPPVELVVANLERTVTVLTRFDIEVTEKIVYNIDKCGFLAMYIISMCSAKKPAQTA